jgi:hypothetical protein
MTTTAKKLTKAEKHSLELHLGGVTSHRDGTVTYKVTYFYRYGRNEDRLVAEVLGLFPGSTIVAKGDRWAEWPRESYFWVRFVPAFDGEARDA